MKHLVLTVSPDSSLSLLTEYADIVILDQNEKPDAGIIYDSIYVRSHFSRLDMLPQVFEKETSEIIHQASANNPKILFIDSMDAVDKIVQFEDKWNQYLTFEEFMPKTWLVQESSIPNANNELIYKKRLSSRGHGISWNVKDTEYSPKDWIAQQSLKINEELRIYVVNGNVCTTGSIRTSKTLSHNASVDSVRSLTNEEIDFALRVSNKVPILNLIGLDIARVGDKLLLLEVNRSPGFAKFYEYSQINLAENLYLGIKSS